MLKYEPSKIEPKWQKSWHANGQNRIDLSDSKKKYYLLVEFTYPSGDLHMGHWFAFAVPDILARMKRMQGYTVFAPNGFDAFGLPAENAAISRRIHPSDWTYDNIKKMKQQFEAMGAIYDWGHEVITCDPEYYRWNQWIFLKMLERGLAYRAKATSNWCPKDQCVLANENVENGRCWRCGSEVVQKEVEQWFLKITDYAEKLLWKESENSENSDKQSLQSSSASWRTAGLKSEGQKTQINQRVRHSDQSDSLTFRHSESSEYSGVDWPKSLREGQNNWIGKSEGAVIRFLVAGNGYQVQGTRHQQPVIEVFTTRVDTLFGATFLVLAPEHPIVASLLNLKFNPPAGGQNSKLAEIREYIKRSQKKSELERKENKEKTGVFTGAYAINPVNGEEIPIWVADYALMGYGTGALFGDAHDERDVEFAKKYGIVLKPTLVTGDRQGDERIKSLEEVFVGDGVLFDSGEFSGFTSARARIKITDWLLENGKGRAEVVYHLHDWSISRQRYWGTPVPVIYCVNCWEVKSQKSRRRQGSGGQAKVKSVEGRDFAIIDGKEHAIVPVPEKDLPVELPYDVDFAPKGKPPLATASEWVAVRCPNCGSEARREVETMDTFVDSSWYFLRYLRKVKSQKSRRRQGSGGQAKAKSEILPWDPELVKAWMPVDIYFGGAEHTLGHTLYSRFFVKFLQDIGVVPPMAPTSSCNAGLRGAGEYAAKRVHHGVILGPDGRRMSKSRGNVVNPDDEVKQYGADAVRLYLAFLGPYDLVVPWDPGGIRGVYHFLERVWRLGVNLKFKIENLKLSGESERMMHKTIKKVGEDIEATKFNTAVAALMEWLNYLSGKAHRQQETGNRKQETSKKVSSFQFPVSSLEYETFLKLLAPFAPHMTEELWQVLRNKLKVESGKLKVKEDQKLSTFNSQFSIHLQPWPEYDPQLAEAKQVTLVVQVNGKLRDRLPVEAGLSREEAEKLALGSPRAQKYLGNKSPRKIIFVPDRLINLVV